MIRPFAAAAVLSLLAMVQPASAQSYAPAWGQPIYLDAWGRPIGGSPLSEVETRAYVETGRWAGGYGERPLVYAPGRVPAYGRSHGGYRRHDRDHRYASDRGEQGRRPYQGYRDEWGYQDDRARPGRRGYVDRRGREDCDCADVYLYDR